MDIFLLEKTLVYINANVDWIFQDLPFVYQGPGDELSLEVVHLAMAYRSEHFARNNRRARMSVADDQQV